MVYTIRIVDSTENVRKADQLSRTGRSKRNHPWAGNPELLVYGIRSIGDLWHKMVWDIVQFEKVLDRPVDPVSVPFGYPNVCVTAVALRDWFRVETSARARASKRPWRNEDADAIIASNVRWFRLAEDVANTFKHRSYRSQHFRNGVVELRVSFPAKLERERALLDDWNAALFTLRHNDVATWAVVFRDSDTGEEIDALKVFWAWEKDWHSLLERLQMLND